MIRMLLLFLVVLPIAAEDLDKLGDVHVEVWRDPQTAQDYLIVTRTCNYQNGHGGGTSVSVAITPRLPAPPAPPADPMRDETFEYSITTTAWNPINGWERVSVVDGTRSRYRRRLDWVTMNRERAP